MRIFIELLSTYHIIYWKVEMNTVRKLLKIDYIEEKGIFGQDIVVAILDTGMAEHPDLKGKIILFKDFIGDREKCYDDNGHGTHVAGIIAGESKDRLYGRMNINGIAKVSASCFKGS